MIQPERLAAYTSGRRIQVRSWEGQQTHPKDDSLLQVPGRKRSSSHSSTPKRRSVASMKGLMPLALSPVGSVSSSPSTPSERMGNDVDGYFPEILAHDLDCSNSVFVSRKLTSGSPEPTLSSHDKNLISSVGWPNRFTITSPYLAASGPVRSLGPIQERNSVVSFLDHQESRFDDSTDLDSLSGTETSRGAAAPSISFREQSIMTAATSMTSSSWATSPRHSPRNSPTCVLRREHSWIDNDSEDDEPGDLIDGNIATLSPRPPTPPESDTSNGIIHDPTTPCSYKQHFHRKSLSITHSIAGSTATSPSRRRHSTRRPESAAAQRPPTSHSSQRGNGRHRSQSSSHQTNRPRAASLQTPRHEASRPSVSRNRTSTTLPAFTQESRPVTEPAYIDDSDDESLFNEGQTSSNGVFIRPSPPPSPLPSVQYWLNGSTHPYGSQNQSDDLAKAVPLPPNVVETLRVSIACFPETMLLTSSLTVETIRNYSRKVRQPSAELLSNLAPDSPSDSPRKSIWKRVVNYKRSPSVQSDRRRAESPSPVSGNFYSPSTCSLAPPKPWQPLKNVFGCASDYICDALWAHILAYNYISAVVPRTPPPRTPAPPPTRHGRSSTSNDNKEEIPKKAAHLLGLADTPGVDRIARKLGSWRQGMVAEQSAKSASYDNATRDIQAGLMRCIIRLIATAKLMAEDGEAEDRVVEIETREVDILFTRGLCEIVRISEEAALS